MQNQNLDQRRAKHALDCIEEIKAGEYKNYRSYAEGLPATILQNGLGQAATMLLARAKGDSKDDHARLYQHLSSWLCRDDEDAPYRNQKDLIHAITSHDERQYLHAHAEAISYLGWLKKFASAFLRKEKSGADD